MTTLAPSENSLRDEYREVARARIVDSAIHVFRDNGYMRSSIVEIAKAAGVSRGTFYSRFPGKSDLLPDLIRRAASYYAGRYGQLTTLFANPDEAELRSWLLDAFGGWNDIADYMRPVYEAIDAEPGLAETLFGGVDPSGAADFTAALMASGVVRQPDRAEATAAVLVAPLMHFFRQSLRGVAFDAELVVDVILGSWLGVLKAPHSL